MTYQAKDSRYDNMIYKRCGKSGLKLPAISLGLWYNFGNEVPIESSQAILRRAFDLGITHFDLANNYGTPNGSAEENFGKTFAKDFVPHRDELLISTKAGYFMWDGPYGEWGSRKYLISSLDQSLKRMGLDYVDIFYSHRPDPNTPLEETMSALDHIVRSGKALYVGISTYSPEQTREASKLLKELGTPCLIHQPRYNLFDRWIEEELLDTLTKEGIGCIGFSPLCQGILTDKYLQNIPKDSRSAQQNGALFWGDTVSPERLNKVKQLNELAKSRGQSMAQLAIIWVLRQQAITSALIGASKIDHVEEAVAALNHITLNKEECDTIESILNHHN